MTTFPGSPRLQKAGIVLIDPHTAAVQRVISLQYNPDSLSRSFQVRGTTGETGDKSEALRLVGPPVETFKIEAQIDAIDQLEFPDQNPNAVQLGIHPQLAALEMLIYPTSDSVRTDNLLAAAGTIEIAPAETPLALFIWSKERVVPVRVTELGITEEAFDPHLNPIRAKVTLGMRVLSGVDLPIDHRGAGIFMSYHQRKERLAQLNATVPLETFGVSSVG